jgi:4-aminobutyrate aminotransferase-like enzyme
MAHMSATTQAANVSALTHLPLPATDPAIRRAIDEISKRLVALQTSITGVVPADPDRADQAAAFHARNAELRGRATLYPYVGSGFGKGALVQLADGSVKWDMISGIGVHMFGHSDTRMIEAALEGALSDLCMQGHIQHNADVPAISEILIAQASRTSALRHCFVANSGCMVNEAALKVCQQKTNAAPRVIAFKDCFMGRSTTMAQLGDSPAYRQGLALNVLVDYMPFYDPLDASASTMKSVAMLRELFARYPKQHSCFVMELVQGEGGFNVAPRAHLAALMMACREAGVPVWVDEIQTFGRTTEMFAFEALGLGELIDVVTIGKMAQVCACLYTEAFNPKPGLLAGTFMASTSAFHVGRRALEIMRDGGYYGRGGRIERMHDAFRAQASALVARRPDLFPCVRDERGRDIGELVGGVGGMMRFTPLGGNKERISKFLSVLYDEGVIALSCGHGPFHVRFLPPVGVMEPAHFSEVFAIVERALDRTIAEEGR